MSACSYCDKSGHNIRTCQKKKQDELKKSTKAVVVPPSLVPTPEVVPELLPEVVPESPPILKNPSEEAPSSLVAKPPTWDDLPDWEKEKAILELEARELKAERDKAKLEVSQTWEELLKSNEELGRANGQVASLQRQVDELKDENEKNTQNFSQSLLAQEQKLRAEMALVQDKYKNEVQEHKKARDREGALKGDLSSMRATSQSSANAFAQKIRDLETRCTRLQQNLIQAQSAASEANSEAARVKRLLTEVQSQAKPETDWQLTPSVVISVPADVKQNELEIALIELQKRVIRKVPEVKIDGITEAAFREFLTRNGYITRVLFDQWHEFMVVKENPKECWIGKGISREDAIHHVLSQMYPSQISRMAPLGGFTKIRSN
jgi:DNA repair exonuclease SbcCD ATPase subunit